MFRLVSVMFAIGVGVFQALYGKPKEAIHPAQTNGQPMKTDEKQEPTKLNLQPLPSNKPVVILGDELTEEEWVLIQSAPQDRN